MLLGRLELLSVLVLGRGGASGADRWAAVRAGGGQDHTRRVQAGGRESR
jgi:hypothetical protein